jgi:hypothetical protein
MGFENFDAGQQNIDENTPVQKKAEEKNTLKNKIQKAVGIGAVAAAVLSAEGCKPTSEPMSVGEAKQLLKDFEPMRKENEAKEKENLSSYYQNVNNPMLQVIKTAKENLTMARAREIVKNKGMLKGDPATGKINLTISTIGLVPVEIKINDQVVPISPDDYTSAELNIVRNSSEEIKNLDTFSASAVSKKPVEESTEKKVFVGHADDF